MSRTNARGNQDSYTQCVLERGGADVVHRQTSWIPSRFASVGRVLRLRSDGGPWCDGWQVVDVGTERFGRPDMQKMIRGHRRSTGDSLPRLSTGE